MHSPSPARTLRSHESRLNPNSHGDTRNRAMKSSWKEKGQRVRTRWLVLLASVPLLIFVFVGFTQDADGRFPVIDDWSWQSQQSIADPTTISREVPTPTPDDIAARKLPLAVPPVVSTVEVIDTAPEVPRDAKYEIVIRRSGGDQEAVLLVPVSTDLKKILDAYTDSDDLVLVDLLKPHLQTGDRVISIAPPRGAGGPRPPATLIP